MTEQNPSYEDMLKKTLLKRTGKNFKRNVGEAKLPDKPVSMSKEEAAEMIFDNILKKRETPKPPPAPAVSHNEEIYPDFLDDLLSPDESPGLETTQISQSPLNYSQALQKTLVNRTDSSAEKPAEFNSELSYEEILDDILGFKEEPEAEIEVEDKNWTSKDQDYLTKTNYNQNLDSILWPTKTKKKV